jgi:hypothetical protein
MTAPMHDPSTVAIEIPNYFVRSELLGTSRHKYRPSLIVVWHTDPETDGTDDSCGWAWPNLSTEERAFVDRLIDNENDNIMSFFPATRKDDAKARVRQSFRLYKRHIRPWWKHPRWHVWHWRIQIIPLQNFKRWAFSRCCKCGGRFTWGYGPTTTDWYGKGPRWFRSEKNTYHNDCH